MGTHERFSHLDRSELRMNERFSRLGHSETRMNGRFSPSGSLRFA